MSPRYVVRPLEETDADALGRAHVLVWQQAYTAHMPAEFLTGLSPERSAQRFREAARRPAPGAVNLVGLADGVPVGFALAGPTRDPVPEPPHELYAINVLAEHHGTGLAEQLFTQAVGHIVAHGPISLWVVRDNARAMAFYARHGFVPDGSTKTHEPTGALEERWVRR